MARRRDAVLAKGCPGWSLESDGAVLGYAYASPFRPRRAYRFCLEDSIYLAPRRAGRGFGRLLLAELLARCEAAGARQMLAVIGDSANAALDRRASRARLRAGRHVALGRLEVRALARRRAHAEGARRRRRDRAGRRHERRPAEHVQGGRHLAGAPRRQPRRCTASTCTAARDPWAWLHPPPTLAGAYGFWRMRALGGTTGSAAGSVPLLGLMLAAGMLSAIVYGLTPDERWARAPRRRGAAHRLGDGDRRRPRAGRWARRR